MSDGSLPFGSNVQGPPFQLPSLYRVDNQGKVRIWSIGYDGADLVSGWGIEGGAMQVSRRSMPTPDVALQEAHVAHQRKQDLEGYRLSLATGETIYNMPAMLCSTWDPTKQQIRNWPVWVSAKLDGCRCRAHTDPTTGAIRLFSRGSQEIQHLTDLRQQLSPVLAALAQVLGHNTFRLDGELYSTTLTFDQISGISRTTVTASAREAEVVYHVFDLILPPPQTGPELIYSARYLILHQVFAGLARSVNPRVQLLDCFSAGSPSEIVRYHDWFVQQGYEGVIIRKLDGLYRGSRTTAMYKYKQFQDAEATVIGAQCSHGGQEDGAILWVLQINGQAVTVRPRGTLAERQQLWQQYQANPNIVLGHKYRYRYQDLTPDGLPRFPVGVGFVYDR